MAYNVGTEEDPSWVNLSVSSGVVDGIVRAFDYETFIEACKVAELLYEVEEAVQDPETGETVLVGTGTWKWSKGVSVDEIGPVVVSPTEYLDDVEITPAVVDDRYHVNIRLTGQALTRVNEEGQLKWIEWGETWTYLGTKDMDINSSEEGLVLFGVSLIDPDSAKTKSRTWL